MKSVVYAYHCFMRLIAILNSNINVLLCYVGQKWANMDDLSQIFSKLKDQVNW